MEKKKKRGGGKIHDSISVVGTFPMPDAEIRQEAMSAEHPGTNHSEWLAGDDKPMLQDNIRE